MFKITPTSLLSTTVNVLWTIAIGLFMVISLAVVGFKFVDALDSHERVSKLHVVDTGRIHIMDARNHSVSAYGVPVTCWAYRSDSKANAGFASDPAYCAEKFELNLPKWEEYQLNNSSNFMLTILTMLLIGCGIFLVVRTGAGIVCLAFDIVSERLISIVSFVISVPFIFTGLLFISGMMQNTSHVWTTPGEYPVQTYRVYRTQDGTFYHAPETVYDWSDSRIGNPVVP